MRNTVLFLCTGNYYRSRFAEIVFNHLADRSSVDWRSDSRALAIELGIANIGPISPHALAGLKSRGYAVPTRIRPPRQLSHDDLAAAALIVALKEAEHRPLLERRYPGWADRVEYWHVSDLDAASADAALTQIDSAVRALIGRLTLVESNVAPVRA